MIRAFWFLMKEGLFNYVKHLGMYTHGAFVVVEHPGYETDTTIYLPHTRVVAKIKLPGWGKLVGYNRIIERELAI
jgi:hypothetical protein